MLRAPSLSRGALVQNFLLEGTVNINLRFGKRPVLSLLLHLLLVVRELREVVNITGFINLPNTPVIFTLEDNANQLVGQVNTLVPIPLRIGDLEELKLICMVHIKYMCVHRKSFIQLSLPLIIPLFL